MILVISLDNENGKKRREFLNYDYETFSGIDGNSAHYILKEIETKMKLRYNISEKTKKGICGCFASKLLALEYIIQKKLDKVILNEDDSIKIKDIPDDLPDDLCLLSGQIHHPTSWKKDREWKKNKENLKIVSEFKLGVNDIDYSKYRWTQINSLWIPTHIHAEKLLDKIKECKSYKHFDILLSDKKLIKKLYYPAPFKHEDNLKKSQVANNPGVIIDYIKV